MEGCLGFQQNWEQSMRGQSKKCLFSWCRVYKTQFAMPGFFPHKFKLNIFPILAPE